MAKKNEKVSTSEKKPKRTTTLPPLVQTPGPQVESAITSDDEDVWEVVDANNTQETESGTTLPPFVMAPYLPVESAITSVNADVSEIVNAGNTQEPESDTTDDLKEIVSLTDKINKEQEKFNDLAEKVENDEELASLITEEIEKTKEIQKTVEKIVKSNKRPSNAEITYFWNGINYGE